MATYTILIKEPAEEWLKKYDKNIQRDFVKKIQKLSENPELHGKPLRTPLHGYWELYFEKSFRIIYTIDFKNSVVYIEAIKHKDEF
ncbi:type II toxin-antitoxin system RelE/ParE family toxin [Methanoregula sp.]|jgi:mRNA-degrading endonuclease RelE of RelBE toxin-antitoxin system|uniref:type II toxin-antitoxin system RelE family toxin n=1 Tax=Methanoregula sp. TaxID=2052170 RepID=UPI0026268747|nr:type II toxin-antitoxin system RelE/ParE family toxin [Methanoregula sp.]MDD5143922.1 type II toxin-antitoxin system RelE/ParE family toxin [Methanoregula sp.]